MADPGTDREGPAHGIAHWPALDGLRAIAVIVVVLSHLPLEWARQGLRVLMSSSH